MAWSRIVHKTLPDVATDSLVFVLTIRVAIRMLFLIVLIMTIRSMWMVMMLRL